MVEEIDRRVKKFLTKMADYGPWLFAATVVIVLVIAPWQKSPSQTVVFPPDKRTTQYWEVETKLRVQIDRNLEETAELLARLAIEADRENYDADTLLAQIRAKRVELRKLMRKLENLREEMALHEKKRHTIKLQVRGEG